MVGYLKPGPAAGLLVAARRFDKVGECSGNGCECVSPATGRFKYYVTDYGEYLGHKKQERIVMQFLQQSQATHSGLFYSRARLKVSSHFKLTLLIFDVRPE